MAKDCKENHLRVSTDCPHCLVKKIVGGNKCRACGYFIEMAEEGSFSNPIEYVCCGFDVDTSAPVVMERRILVDSLPCIATEQTTNHDSHYRAIEGTGDPEPIVAQESLIERLINAEVNPRRALDIAMGQKHISRAGMKTGEPWEKEIEKAINYLTRGLTGEWKK